MVQAPAGPATLRASASPAVAVPEPDHPTPSPPGQRRARRPHQHQAAGCGRVTTLVLPPADGGRTPVLALQTGDRAWPPQGVTEQSAFLIAASWNGARSGLNSVLQKGASASWLTVCMNGTLFGNRVFAGGGVKMRPYWAGMGPDPVTHVCVRRGTLELRDVRRGKI